MAEYINKENIISQIENVLKEHKDETNSVAFFAFEMFVELLKKAPTADVVEVVRCKDCIEFIQTNSCGGVCGLDYHKVSCDGYCSDGNRK